MHSCLLGKLICSSFFLHFFWFLILMHFFTMPYNSFIFLFRSWAFTPFASDFQSIVLLLSVFLCPSYYRLVLLVMVVFFYLLILKDQHSFQVSFRPRNSLDAFVLESLCSLGCCWRPPQRGQAGGRVPAPHPASSWGMGGWGLRPPWQQSSPLLALSHFLARPWHCMPDLTSQTFFLVRK